MNTFARSQQLISQALPRGVMIHRGALLRQHHAINSILHDQGHLLQPKLLSNTPDGRYEQEADRAAAQVLATPMVPSADSTEVNDDQETSHQSMSRSGQPLDKQTRSFFESRFNYDFSGVRVHTSTVAADSAQAENARAYTIGQDIVFARNQYAPDRHDGRQLLAHELSHVIQQSPQAESGHSGVAASLSRVPRGMVQKRLIPVNEARDFTELANAIIRYYYQVDISSRGDVVLNRIPMRPSRFAPPGSEVSVTHLTPAAEELVSVLQQVIGHGITPINFVHGHAGGYPGAGLGAAAVPEGPPIHTIDLDDIAALGFQWELGERSGGTAGALMAHEILEAYRMAVRHEAFPIAHEAALEAEYRASGAYRSGPDSSSAHWQRSTAVPHELDVYAYVYPDGHIIDVMMHTMHGNIIEIHRAARPYERVEFRTFTYQAREELQTFRPVVENGQARFERL